MHEYVSITVASKILGVNPKTLRRWDAEGKLKSYRTPNGHRRYLLQELESLALGRENINSAEIKNKVYIYSRVSNRKQYDSCILDRQTERLKAYCSNKNYKIVEIFTEVASDLNDNRPKLMNMLSKLDEIDKIIVESPDILARFGLNYLVLMLKKYGVEVEFVELNTEKTLNELKIGNEKTNS